LALFFHWENLAHKKTNNAIKIVAIKEKTIASKNSLTECILKKRAKEKNTQNI
jgi:hypothetical protein